MLRRLGPAWRVPALAILVVVGIACQSARQVPESTRAGQSRPPARSSRPASSASQFDPTVIGPWYRLVGLPQFDIQGSSRRLVEMVGARHRLEVEALRSEQGTVALKFVETATPDNQWGAVMTLAERRVFGAFAADPSMGNWLIMFTDVMVVGGADPIPLTGYRWAREDVEAYASCGIRESGLDTCARVFYAQPQMVLLPSVSTDGGSGGKGK
jgi:hypothetical protein